MMFAVKKPNNWDAICHHVEREWRLLGDEEIARLEAKHKRLMAQKEEELRKIEEGRKKLARKSCLKNSGKRVKWEPDVGKEIGRICERSVLYGFEGGRELIIGKLKEFLNGLTVEDQWRVLCRLKNFSDIYAILRLANAEVIKFTRINGTTKEKKEISLIDKPVVVRAFIHCVKDIDCFLRIEKDNISCEVGGKIHRVYPGEYRVSVHFANIPKTTKALRDFEKK